MPPQRPPGKSASRALHALALANVLLLSGCFATTRPQDTRAWLLYVREVPVAQVVLKGKSTGNVVDVSVQGDTAAVTLRHHGEATLLPLPEARPPGLTLAFFKEDLRRPPPQRPRMTAEHLSRLLVEGKYDAIQRALDEAPSVERDDLSVDMLEAAPEPVLFQAVENERGRRLLDRLFDELTSGVVGDREREQARAGGAGGAAPRHRVRGQAGASPRGGDRPARAGGRQ